MRPFENTGVAAGRSPSDFKRQSSFPVCRSYPAGGVEVTWVRIKDGRIPVEDLDKAIVKGKTRLVAVSATSFVNGFQHDLKRVSEMAHAKGAMVYADIIQRRSRHVLDGLHQQSGRDRRLRVWLRPSPPRM